MTDQIIRAAGGVLCREEGENLSVLMIRRNGVWDLPKGKFEEGESVPECAIREVEEETGVRGVTITGYLTETYHEYEEGGQTIGKKTDWYAMKSSHGELKPQLEEGITELRWVPISEAEEMAGYENLRVVLREVNRKGRKKR